VDDAVRQSSEQSFTTVATRSGPVLELYWLKSDMYCESWHLFANVRHLDGQTEMT